MEKRIKNFINKLEEVQPKNHEILINKILTEFEKLPHNNSVSVDFTRDEQFYNMGNTLQFILNNNCPDKYKFIVSIMEPPCIPFNCDLEYYNGIIHVNIVDKY